MSGLLPCPFCGNTKSAQEYDRNNFRVFIECPQCGARGPGVSTISDDPNDTIARVMAVRDQWNMRGGAWEVDNA